MTSDVVYIQEEFVGKTFTDKLNDKLIDYFQERKFSELGYLPRPGVIGMVHTLEDGTLKAVGASAPQDVINNNWGKWLAAMFSPVGNTQNDSNQQIGFGDNPVKTDGTNLSNVFFYNLFDDQYNGFTSGHVTMQIGLGFSTPLVTDFDIETAFANAPESLKTGVLTGSYSPPVGRVQVGVNIGPTVGAGTVRELGIFQSWQVAANLYMLSHDAISPGVPFVIGETLFCQYFWQI